MDKDENNINVEAIIKSSALLRSIDMMGVGMAITDPSLEDNPLVYVNQGFEKITGYSREEVLHKNPRFLQGEETDTEHLKIIKRAIQTGKAETATIKNYRKDGTTFWNQFILSPLVEDGKPIYFIGLQFDVTGEVEERQASHQKIQQLSYFDSLTGLLNTNRFKEITKRRLEQSEANHTTAAILRFNINRFRYINGSYG